MVCRADVVVIKRGRAGGSWLLGHSGFRLRVSSRRPDFCFSGWQFAVGVGHRPGSMPRKAPGRCPGWGHATSRSHEQQDDVVPPVFPSGGLGVSRRPEYFLVAENHS